MSAASGRAGVCCGLECACSLSLIEASFVLQVVVAAACAACCSCVAGRRIACRVLPLLSLKV